MTAAAELVHTELHGGVGVLTLDDPEHRNALSAHLVAAIASALDTLESDERTRCIVITGRGKAFCAGADLGVLTSAVDGDFDSVKLVYDGFLRVLASPLPTIAAVNGPAVGAGFNLALACDVRFAGSSARFDTRFAQLRIHPGGGHTWLLTRAVGAEQATRASLFGEIWSAADALRVGLVSEVVEDDELITRAVRFGAALEHQSAEFVRRLIASLRMSATPVSHADALSYETDAQLWSTQQPEFAAGLAALLSRLGQDGPARDSGRAAQ